jgi:ABC-type amino acid transport substrate-binding protein
MQEYEPFNWISDAVPSGGMYEVVKEVCTKLKIKCNFQSLPMKRVIAMLSDGETDGVLSLIPNSDRDTFAELSVPSIESNMSYFAKKGHFKKAKKLRSLAGATVGVVETSSAEKMVQAHNLLLENLNIIRETGLTILLNKFVAGRYGTKGLVFANQDVFSNLLRKAKIDNYEVVFVAKKESFSKKKMSPSFVKEFDSEIRKMKKSGELKRILAPYHLKAAL